MKALTGMIMQSGSSPSTANIKYLCGFDAPDPFFYLHTSKGGHLLVSTMEKGRALRQSRSGTGVYTASDLGLSGKKVFDKVEQIKALMQHAGVRSLKVPSDFPAGLFQLLLGSGIGTSILKGDPCPDRAVKKSEEITKLKGCQKAAAMAMESAINMLASARVSGDGHLRVGREVLTSEHVRRRIQAVLLEMGFTASQTIVAGGEQATDPHERGHGPLKAGEAIILDIFPQSETTGYWGDLTRTVCRGKAPTGLKKLYRAVKAAQAAALSTVAPGISAQQVHAAVEALFEERGYETGTVGGKHVGFIHGTGHGVGLDIHEMPRVSSASTAILEPGHIITIEPGLYYPGLGGVRIEDTIVVTEKGWKYLAACPRKFELF